MAVVVPEYSQCQASSFRGGDSIGTGRVQGLLEKLDLGHGTSDAGTHLDKLGGDGSEGVYGEVMPCLSDAKPDNNCAVERGTDIVPYEED